MDKQLRRETINATKRSLRGIGKADINKLKKEQLQPGGSLNVKSKAFRKSFKYKLYGRDLNDLELSQWSGSRIAEIFTTGGTVKAKNKLMPVFFGNKPTRPEYKANFASGRYIVFKSKSGNLIIFDNQLDKPIGVLKGEIHQQKRLYFYENHSNNAAEHEKIINEQFEKSLQKLMGDKT